MGSWSAFLLWRVRLVVAALMFVLSLVTLCVGLVKEVVPYPVLALFSERTLRDAPLSSAVPLAYLAFELPVLWWSNLIEYSLKKRVNFVTKAQLMATFPLGFFLLCHVTGIFDAFTLTLLTLMAFFSLGFLFVHEVFMAVMEIDRDDPFTATFGRSWAPFAFWTPFTMSFLMYVAQWIIFLFFYNATVAEQPQFEVALFVLLLVAQTLYYVLELMKYSRYRLFSDVVWVEVIYLTFNATVAFIVPITLLSGMTGPDVPLE
jgi:hypothetical protein